MRKSVPHPLFYPLTPVQGLFINLTGYPPLLQRRGGGDLERGEAPLLPTFPLPLIREGSKKPLTTPEKRLDFDSGASPAIS